MDDGPLLTRRLSRSSVLRQISSNGRRLLLRPNSCAYKNTDKMSGSRETERIYLHFWTSSCRRNVCNCTQEVRQILYIRLTILRRIQQLSVLSKHSDTFLNVIIIKLSLINSEIITYNLNIYILILSIAVCLHRH